MVDSIRKTAAYLELKAAEKEKLKKSGPWYQRLWGWLTDASESVAEGTTCQMESTTELTELAIGDKPTVGITSTPLFLLLISLGTAAIYFGLSYWLNQRLERAEKRAKLIRLHHDKLKKVQQAYEQQLEQCLSARLKEHFDSTLSLQEKQKLLEQIDYSEYMRLRAELNDYYAAVHVRIHEFVNKRWRDNVSAAVTAALAGLAFSYPLYEVVLTPLIVNPFAALAVAVALTLVVAFFVGVQIHREYHRHARAADDEIESLNQSLKQVRRKPCLKYLKASESRPQLKKLHQSIEQICVSFSATVPCQIETLRNILLLAGVSLIAPVALPIFITYTVFSVGFDFWSSWRLRHSDSGQFQVFAQQYNRDCRSLAGDYQAKPDFATEQEKAEWLNAIKQRAEKLEADYAELVRRRNKIPDFFQNPKLADKPNRYFPIAHLRASDYLEATVRTTTSMLAQAALLQMIALPALAVLGPPGWALFGIVVIVMAVVAVKSFCQILQKRAQYNRDVHLLSQQVTDRQREVQAISQGARDQLAKPNADNAAQLSAAPQVAPVLASPSGVQQTVTPLRQSLGALSTPALPVISRPALAPSGPKI